MRVLLQTAPLLLIGLVSIGCGKERASGSGSQPQGKLDPGLPSVTLNIPSMH
jgi:hypothetical protein